jgi:hypothetical protein
MVAARRFYLSRQVARNADSSTSKAANFSGANASCCTRFHASRAE